MIITINAPYVIKIIYNKRYFMSKAQDILKAIDEMIHSDLPEERKLSRISEMTADRRKDDRDYTRSICFPVIVHIIKYLEFNMSDEIKRGWIKEITNKWLNTLTSLTTKGNRKVSKDQLEAWMKSCIRVDSDSRRYIKRAIHDVGKKPDLLLNNEEVMNIWNKFVDNVTDIYQFGEDFTQEQIQEILDKIKD